MRLIDADRIAVNELIAFIFAQAITTDAANRDINSIVHEKIQRLIADTPTVENDDDDVVVGQCSECDNEVWLKWDVERDGRTAYCPHCGYSMEVEQQDGECKNDKNGRTTETAEPQPDSIQFRTVDDLGRICIPKDIRDKLGIQPGTECAVYSTDELMPYEIIVIRRK